MATRATSTLGLPDSLSACLEHAPSPMAAVEGAMHTVRYVNPAFCMLVRKTQDELVGKPFSGTVPERDESLALLDRVFRTGASESHTSGEHADPRPVFSSCAMWPVVAGESTVGVIVQVITSAPLQEKTLAMNEALILGLLRQHKSHEAADQSNIELRTENTDRKQREEQIVALSLTDPLTGVANRRLMAQALTLEINRAERTGGKFSVCMVDIDHFKRVNDIHGHEAGDKVLVAFGELLRLHTRQTDIVARFGGEEFVILLPHTSLEYAIATANRIREAFAACRVEPLSNPVTASFGVVELAESEQGDALLRRADKALYEAKESGRNCVMPG
jgi:diguanylate cyclase (GGDEF)-like protein